jgi:tetratricopeptide (TPR) repeat protein
MRIWLILFAGFFSLISSACINAEGFSIFGSKTFYDLPISFIKKIDIEKYRADALKRARQLIAEYRNKSPDVHYYNELGVVRIFEGKRKEAKQLLMQGLKLDSMNYGLNSNLAVVMELEGDLDSAQLLLQKAVGINKQAHFGSEWIHLKILEATMKTLDDKNWIYKHNVIDFKALDDSLPFKKRRYGAIRTIMEIEFQLKERLVFVKPVNVIVANLLLYLADLYSSEADFRYANETYLLAKEYDPKLSGIVDKRLAYIKLHGDEIIAKFKKDTSEQKEKQKEKQSESEDQQQQVQQQKDTVKAAGQNTVNANTAPKKKHKKVSNYIFFGGLGLILIIAASLYRRRKR